MHIFICGAAYSNEKACEEHFLDCQDEHDIKEHVKNTSLTIKMRMTFGFLCTSNKSHRDGLYLTIECFH